MRLRIGQNHLGYWVEQKRWYGLWRKCRSDLQDAWAHWRDIRFCTKRSSCLFNNYQAAQQYLIEWYQAYSIRAKRFKNSKKKKAEYEEVNAKKLFTEKLLKDGT